MVTESLYHRRVAVAQRENILFLLMEHFYPLDLEPPHMSEWTLQRGEGSMTEMTTFNKSP